MSAVALSASPVNMKFGQFQSDPLEGVGAQGGALSLIHI